MIVGCLDAGIGSEIVWKSMKIASVSLLVDADAAVPCELADAAAKVEE